MCSFHYLRTDVNKKLTAKSMNRNGYIDMFRIYINFTDKPLRRERIHIIRTN